MFILNFFKNKYHVHEWELVKSFHERDYSYKHEHYKCKCGLHKHIKQHWNKNKPEIKIFK